MDRTLISNRSSMQGLAAAESLAPRRVHAPPDVRWMRALGQHFERMRRSYPDDQLCIVFDIDGTILDTRHLVVHVLMAYDQAHGTDHFLGLRAHEVKAREDRPEELLETFALPEPVRADVLAWYRDHCRDPGALLAAHRPYEGVLGVIRWFQLQRATSVALNTGRPEPFRQVTLDSLNALGGAYRVAFDPDLLMMNPSNWGRGVEDAKVAGLQKLRDSGHRIVAVVDDEPANIRAMAETDETGEILFLLADTIFQARRVMTPRTAVGSIYDLAELIPERELRQRVEFVWHGVNDVSNLRQFVASEVRWAECDVRDDPLGRLVLRHDGFDERPWRRGERPLLLEDCLGALHDAGRNVKIDLKRDGHVVEGVIDEVGRSGLEPDSIWFNGAIETLRADGFRRLAAAYPDATISCPADLFGPLLAAAPNHADDFLDTLARWGINRLSISWDTPGVREALGQLERRGWEVNVYGVRGLGSFLEAALLLPRSVTADFNFPHWGYFGRGSGAGDEHHEYALAPRNQEGTSVEGLAEWGSERRLVTVLVTDIVDSTHRAVELGDSRWNELLAAHHDRVRTELGRFRGQEIDTAGDGFLAMFDAPARAVECARAIAGSVRELGLEIRVGCHTGEVEVVDDDVRGIAIHLGSRITGLAGPSEVLVSSTVKDLVAGSGLPFEDVGEHQLKGIPDRWRLYRATP